MTRVAHLDEAMWTELFLDNADYLTEQLDILIQHLQEYQSALCAQDAERLCARSKTDVKRKPRREETEPMELRRIRVQVQNGYDVCIGRGLTAGFAVCSVRRSVPAASQS